VTAPVPNSAQFFLGAGGFRGYILIQKPDMDNIKSLPKLAQLTRPAYVVAGLEVHPLRRGKGWAGSLLTAAKKYCRAMDHDLYLWVKPYGNLPDKTKRQLQTLYRRHGFVRVTKTDESWYFWGSI
jgi:GNAT superfamily N-acetyltransferase